MIFFQIILRMLLAFLLLGIASVVVLDWIIRFTFAGTFPGIVASVIILLLLLAFLVCSVLLLWWHNRKMAGLFMWWKRWFVIFLIPVALGMLWIPHGVFRLLGRMRGI